MWPIFVVIDGFGVIQWHSRSVSGKPGGNHGMAGDCHGRALPDGLYMLIRFDFAGGIRNLWIVYGDWWKFFCSTFADPSARYFLVGQDKSTLGTFQVSDPNLDVATAARFIQTNVKRSLVQFSIRHFFVFRFFPTEKKSINQSTNQATKRRINQPINQSTNR